MRLGNQEALREQVGKAIEQSRKTNIEGENIQQGRGNQGDGEWGDKNQLK